MLLQVFCVVTKFKRFSALEGTSSVARMRRHFTTHTFVQWLVNYITGSFVFSAIFDFVCCCNLYAADIFCTVSDCNLCGTAN